MNTEILENLGLSQSEIKTYITLLELGSSTAGPILEKSDLPNSVLHRALNSLIEKGIITHILEGKRKIYQATNPEHFYDFIEENNIKHIYLDYDETLVDSIEAVLKQLNPRYGTNFKPNECKTWNFTNLFPNLKEIELEEIFDSEQFFEDVKWKDGALSFIGKFHDKITIVSNGYSKNLYLKERWIREYFPDIKFIGCEFGVMDKSEIEMGDRDLFIDDNQDNLLSSTASYCVLFENVKGSDWNDCWEDGNDYFGKDRTMKGWI